MRDHFSGRTAGPENAQPDEAPRRFDVLLTAAEAFPAFEEAFLGARQEIVAAFRVFDPFTKLRSDAARRIGDHWFDLIVNTLNRGVKIDLMISDFDPVVRLEMHRSAWQALRGLTAAAEASSHPENLQVRVAMHPARVGLLPRTLLWPKSLKEVAGHAEDLNKLDQASRRKALATAPGLRALTQEMPDGRISAKKFPPPPLFPVTHHQKIAVFDDDLLYVGGLDLDNRRFDDPNHNRPGDQTWHDVQVMVSGPAVLEAKTHLQTMEKCFHGAASSQPRSILRTISGRRRFALPFMSPKRQVGEIMQAHLDAIGRTEKLIYCETQFFRDRELADAIAKRAAACPDLSMILLLPAAPDDIAFSSDWGPDAAFGEHLQVQCLDRLHDALGDRLFVGSPVKKRTSDSDGRDAHFGSPIIYIHAKVSLFDARYGIISSANLNGRSMKWDTECGVQTETAAEAQQIKERCFSHWLGDAPDDAFFDLDTATAAWTDRAESNARSAPEDRQGFIVPYRTAPARADAQPLPGVPEAMA